MWWYLTLFLAFAQPPELGIFVHTPSDFYDLEALHSVIERKSLAAVGSRRSIQLAWKEETNLVNLDLPRQCTPKTCTLLKAQLMGWAHAMVVTLRAHRSGWLFRVTMFDTQTEQILSSQSIFLQEGRDALDRYEAIFMLIQGDLDWREQDTTEPADPTGEIIVDIQKVDSAIIVEDEQGILSCLIPSGTYKNPCVDCAQGYILESIPQSFFMMQHEVSQDLYAKITQRKPSQFFRCGGDCPVERVSWYEAIQFANALSTEQGFEPCYQISGNKVEEISTCLGWRLPTKSLWMYAAQAGQDPPPRFSGGDGVDESAWYVGNSAKRTHRVCQKKKNAYGLWDMSGNVWEWIWEMGQQSTKELMGGSWGNQAEKTELSSSTTLPPSTRNYAVGFRLMRLR